MKIHPLEKLFNPTSIAVIGASDKLHSVGEKVFKNLLQSDYVGELYPINPKHKKIFGKRCFTSIHAIKKSIDLVVIITPAKTVPEIMQACGEHGIRFAIVISAGFSEVNEQGKILEKAVKEIAHKFNIRWIGPNCLGMMRPSSNLNATFNNNFVIDGHMALISQSGALCAAIIDWAIDKKVGFSTIISLGNGADIDFDEILHYLQHDKKTNSILLYIEGVHDGKKFIASLASVAKVKPVIAIKGGKYSQGSRAAHSHTGALVGDDDVFDAVLRQCGVIRVLTIEQLFLAAEILSSNCRIRGNRLGIITNGGGAGVMAADFAAKFNICLPNLTKTTVTQLNKILPDQWSHQNPIDIIGDATPERYQATLNICLQAKNFDALLVILVPVALAQPIRAAKQIAITIKQSTKPIVTCWMGENQVKSSRNLFAKHNIPSFATPEKAIEALSYLTDYRNNQQLLLQQEKIEKVKSSPNNKVVHAIIKKAAAENRKILTTVESKNILQAFAIPISKTISAKTANSAVKTAETMQYPLVMKIDSPDITHKKDAGGIQLNILNTEGVRKAFDAITNNVKHFAPNAKIFGVTVEHMYKNPNDRELMIGVVNDPVFGPVISFGFGGSLVEIFKDRAIAVPPLNQFIARRLISRTKIAKALEKFRNMPAANLNLIIDVLMQVSNMLVELPQILEMDINPLIVNNTEVIAVDARIIIRQATLTPNKPGFDHK